jgi:hypothetical protein
MYVPNIVLNRIEKLDKTLPVVLKDSDSLLKDILTYFEDQGWHCFELDELNNEWLTMMNAENLNQAGRKVLIYIGQISEKDLKYLAEYWDRGNGELVTAINLLSDMGINRKDFKKDFLVSLVKYGLTKDEGWWSTFKKKGIEEVYNQLEEIIQKLLDNPSFIDNMNEANKDFILSHFINTVFKLNLSKDSSGREASTLVAEKILESSYKDSVSDEIRKYYKAWEDSMSGEESIMKHATKFASSHKAELLNNIDTFKKDHKHPFTIVEKAIFKEKMEELIQGKSPKKAIQFAKQRATIRKRDKTDAKEEIFWNELAQLEPLSEEIEFPQMSSLESFLNAYDEILWKFDYVDRFLKTSQLPEKIKEWANEKNTKMLESISNCWESFYKINDEESEQPGLIKRLLESKEKVAVIVVDAMRYEMAKSSNSITGKKEIKPVLAMTPTETTVGMGALFSSGDVKKILKDNKTYLYDKQTDRVLSNVNKREENLKELVKGTEIVNLNESIPESEKLVIKTIDIDSLGHDELIEFFSKTLDKIHDTTSKLLKDDYVVHIVSDHGFYLPKEDEIIKQNIDGSYDSGTRYGLKSSKPAEGAYEEVDGIYIYYTKSDNVFKKYGGNFWHGGVSHQEVIIPLVTYTPKKTNNKINVQIMNKDNLKHIQRNKIDLIINPQNTMFGEPRKVYIQYLGKKVNISEPISDITKIALDIEAENGTKFKIEVRDSDDSSRLDYVECEYVPARELPF